MKLHKLISAILHPIVMPTIGVLLYFMYYPYNLSDEQQLTILGVVFISTYIIPLLLLVFLKSIGFIESFEVHSIKERRITLFFMIILLYFLATLFQKLILVRDLSYLFFGVVLGLLLTKIVYYTKVNSSLHLLSMGGAVGYFILFKDQKCYQV